VKKHLAFVTVEDEIFREMLMVSARHVEGVIRLIVELKETITQYHQRPK
jgi:hypothetical protein